uniref:Uncharacterized protein n=1 Tax=Anguilla anguilla TaxID=7936 RepID=A0A0E9VSC4_ANGAN
MHRTNGSSCRGCSHQSYEGGYHSDVEAGWL